MAADHTRNGVVWNNLVKTKAAPQPSQAIAQRSLPHVVISSYKIAILLKCKHKLKNDPLDHFFICMATKNSYLPEFFRTGNCFLILVPNMGILNAILPGSGILIDD